MSGDRLTANLAASAQVRTNGETSVQPAGLRVASVAAVAKPTVKPSAFTQSSG